MSFLYIRRSISVNVSRRRGFIFVLLALILPVVQMSQTAYGQSGTGSVQGRVLDPSGAVLPRAELQLTRRSSSWPLQVQPDETGSYSFKGLEPGDYYLTATAPGFSVTLRELDLAAGETATEDFQLGIAVLSESLSVTAARVNVASEGTPIPVTIIERRQIEQSNLATVGDLFRQVPGTTVVGEGPFRVRPKIRGLDSNRVLVLVDGERLNNARTSTSHSGIEVGLVDMSTIEQVEITRGSGSVLYGTDALGGTINIITRRPQVLEDSGLRLSGGFQGLLSSNETGRQGMARVGLASARMTLEFSQGLDRFEDYRAGGALNDTVANSSYHGSNSRAEGRFYLGDRQSVRVSYARRRAGDIGVPGLAGIFTAWFPYSNRDKVAASWQMDFPSGPLSNVRASGYWQEQKRNFTNLLSIPAAPPSWPGQSQFSETATDTETVGFDVQTHWIPGRDNVLTVGASYFRDRNQDTRYIEQFNPDFRSFPPGLIRSEDRSQSVPDATFSNFAVFAQDDHKITPRVHLIVGARVDIFDIRSQLTSGFALPISLTGDQLEDLGARNLDRGLDIDETASNGNVGVVFNASDNVSLSARVGSSFREPNLFERFFTDFGSTGGFVVGNPELEPERGVNFDTGLRIGIGAFRGTGTVFYNRYSNFLTSSLALDRNGDVITLADGTEVYQTINSARVRTWGIETEFEIPFSIGASTLVPSAGLSYMRGDDLEFGQPLDFITPLKTVFGLRWQDDRNRFWSEYGTRMVTKQERLSSTYLEANGGLEPGYVVHDLRGGMNLLRKEYRMGVTVGFLNLGNRLYREQFGVAAARGRTFTLGLNTNF